MGTKLEYDEIVRILEGLVKDYERTLKNMIKCSDNDALALEWEKGFLVATIGHLSRIEAEIDDLSDHNGKLIEAAKKFIGMD